MKNPLLFDTKLKIRQIWFFAILLIMGPLEICVTSLFWLMHIFITVTDDNCVINFKFKKTSLLIDGVPNKSETAAKFYD